MLYEVITDSLFTGETLDYYLEQGNTNWQDLIYQTAISSEHQLVISGGKEKIRYALIAGYLDKEGIVKNSYFDRGSIRLNLDREFNNNLSVGFNTYTVISQSSYNFV